MLLSNCGWVFKEKTKKLRDGECSRVAFERNKKYYGLIRRHVVLLTLLIPIDKIDQGP